jgi:stage II sporulation protein D
MKRVSYLIISIIAAIVILPLLVLNGSGPGIRLKSSAGGAITFPSQNKDSQASGVAEFNDKNGGGPKIKVYIAEKKVLQEMYLEEYIRGVVCGEMPAEFDIEALKAQAVAARTYAVTRMKAYGGKGCERNADADICTDSAHCQEWISKEDRFKAWGAVNAQGYWDKVTKAVDETKGLILTFDAAPVMYPLYFSTSSGKTENSQDYFKNSQPYLKSVTSPNEEESPKFITKAAFSLDELVNKIYASTYKIKLDKSKLSTQFKILNRTEGGAVKDMQVGSKTITGRDIREILGLNSSNFAFELGKTNITFTVTGNGHGVGMSQWGANEMGKRGSKFDEILKHYYQGVEIKKIDDVFASK